MALALDGEGSSDDYDGCDGEGVGGENWLWTT